MRARQPHRRAPSNGYVQASRRHERQEDKRARGEAKVSSGSTFSGSLVDEKRSRFIFSVREEKKKRQRKTKKPSVHYSTCMHDYPVLSPAYSVPAVLRMGEVMRVRRCFSACVQTRQRVGGERAESKQRCLTKKKSKCVHHISFSLSPHLVPSLHLFFCMHGDGLPHLCSTPPPCTYEYIPWRTPLVHAGTAPHERR